MPEQVSNNLVYDITLRSYVFNPTGPPGQWMFHRFGRRHFVESSREDLFSSAMNIFWHLLGSRDITNVRFQSTGDSLRMHKHVKWDDVFKKYPQTTFTFYTYATQFAECWDELGKEPNIRFVLRLDGLNELCGKVFLNADYNQIKDFLLRYGDRTEIEFHRYKHNQHQVGMLEEFKRIYGCDYVVRDGVTYGQGLANIITGSGQWLYDVFAVDSDGPKNLVKTVEGWNSLKRYINVAPKGKTILNNPSFPGVYEDINFGEPTDTIYIASTGHMFPTFDWLQLFTNTLYDDWEIPLQDYDYSIDDPYTKSVLSKITLLRSITLDRLKDPKIIEKVWESPFKSWYPT